MRVLMFAALGILVVVGAACTGGPIESTISSASALTASAEGNREALGWLVRESSDFSNYVQTHGNGTDGFLNGSQLARAETKSQANSAGGFHYTIELTFTDSTVCAPPRVTAEFDGVADAQFYWSYSALTLSSPGCLQGGAVPSSGSANVTGLGNREALGWLVRESPGLTSLIQSKGDGTHSFLDGSQLAISTITSQDNGSGGFHYVAQLAFTDSALCAHPTVTAEFDGFADAAWNWSYTDPTLNLPGCLQ